MFKKTLEKFTEKSILDLRNDWHKDSFFDKRVGEGVKRVNAELDVFLAEFGYIHDRVRGVYKVKNNSAKRIAIFAHQAFGMVFFSSILDIPYPIYSTHFDISHSCVSAIHFSESNTGEVVPKLLFHSNDSHLYKEGLPTTYNNGIHI